MRPAILVTPLQLFKPLKLLKPFKPCTLSTFHNKKTIHPCGQTRNRLLPASTLKSYFCPHELDRKTGGESSRPRPL